MLLTPKEKPHKLCVFWKNDCKKHTKFLNDLSFPSKPLLILYTEEINKFWNCFLSSSGYSNMGKKCKYGWFFKGHQWCWYRFPNCNFPPDFGPLCNGFFFRLYHVRCAFFSTRPHTILVLYQKQKNMKTMKYVQCRIHKWSVKLTMFLLFVLIICRLINFLIS